MRLHHGSNKANPKMTISGMHIMALVWDLGKCSTSRSVSYAIPCLDCYKKYSK